MRPGHFIYYCISLLSNHALPQANSTKFGPSVARADQLQAVSGFEAGDQFDGSKDKTKAPAKAPAKAAKGPAKEQWIRNGHAMGVPRKIFLRQGS